MNHNEIQKLFGTPLNQLHNPNLIPKKVKVIAALVILGLASYGAYVLYKNVIGTHPIMKKE